MIGNKDALHKIEQVLGAVYRSAPQGEVGPGWEERLMRAVRALGPLEYRYTLTDLFQRYFWRLAPAATLIILILGSILYYQTGFLIDGDLAQLFVPERFDDSLFQVLGIS